MARIIVLSKMNHKTQSQMFAADTYTGKEKTGSMVLKPTKELKQWLKEADKLYAREARKQA